MIYVNANSSHLIELGTVNFPYKTLDSAFIEVWNHWKNLSTPVRIMVMEDTMNFVWYKQRPLLIFNRTDITMCTYKVGAETECADQEDTATAKRAKIHVTDLVEYSPNAYTRFNVMQAHAVMPYPTTPGALDSSEEKAISSKWYSILAIKSQFKMDGFSVTNKLKLLEDDFAFIAPINLELRKLSIFNTDFVIYGTVMNAFTVMSFHSYNVKIDTEQLVGGYVFVVTCDPDNGETTGDVLIDKLTLDGKRSILFKYGGVYMTGPQNFTI